jgi:hypothetical protein
LFAPARRDGALLELARSFTPALRCQFFAIPDHDRPVRPRRPRKDAARPLARPVLGQTDREAFALLAFFIEFRLFGQALEWEHGHSDDRSGGENLTAYCLK